jgi:hypothetical protein
MSDDEVRRRNLHGFLSSKSLLEAIDNLTLNKQKLNEKQKNNDNSLHFEVSCNNKKYFIVPSELKVDQVQIKSDESQIPLTVKFTADHSGIFSGEIELRIFPDDIRIIPLNFKVTENSKHSDTSTPCLQFNSCVFETITQKIPLRNNSEHCCNYEVSINIKNSHGSTSDLNKNDKNVFRGVSKFVINSKDSYLYDLIFIPTSEKKFQGEIVFNNVTEGILTRYVLEGIGEQRPALGEIKLNTKVGNITEHEIMIPNKSNEKICFYVSSTSPFVRGPSKIMLLPNRREPYKFQIRPLRRGEYKSIVTFKPGEWPIKDIDSDGEDICSSDSSQNKLIQQQFTLWFSLDLTIKPNPPQSLIEIEGHCGGVDASILCIPLSNPLSKMIQLDVTRKGSFLESPDTIQISPKGQLNFELFYRPQLTGKFKGSIIFYNENIGEFWYELKMTAKDALPIKIDTFESEVGRFSSKTIKLNNPLAEPAKFRFHISNTNNFTLERHFKTSERITVPANSFLEIKIIFTPSTIGYSGHESIISFYNEKIGTISYDLIGVGIEPETQDPINITAELGHTQMVTVNFRNSTNSAVICDMNLYGELITTSKEKYFLNF